MKKSMLVAAPLITLVIFTMLATSCDTQEEQDQRCYGLMKDSLVKMAVLQERNFALEMDLLAAENTADSLLAETIQCRRTADSLIAQTQPIKPLPQPPVADPSNTRPVAAVTTRKRSWYYNRKEQKNYFYDPEVGAYYNRKPETFEKRFKNRN